MSNLKQPQGDVLYALQVPISAEAAAYIEKNKGDRTAAERLAGYIRWMIDRQARGGLMIEPADMDYLASLNQGQRLETSKDVVKAVEIALNRNDGQYAFTITVDPTLVAPLEESASYQGITAQQLLGMVVTEGMQNGWAANYTPEQGRHIPMAKETVDTCMRVLGKKIFEGVDIAAALVRLEKLEAGKPKLVAA